MNTVVFTLGELDVTSFALGGIGVALFLLPLLCGIVWLRRRVRLQSKAQTLSATNPSPTTRSRSESAERIATALTRATRAVSQERARVGTGSVKYDTLAENSDDGGHRKTRNPNISFTQELTTARL